MNLKLSKNYLSVTSFSKIIAKIFSKLNAVKTSIAILIFIILAKPIIVDILSLPITNLIVVFMIIKIVLKLFKPFKISTIVPKIGKRNLTYFAIFLLTIGILTAAKHYNENKVKCVNPYEVKNTTSSNETIKICNNTLYAGSIKIVDEKEFPDLFNLDLNKDDKQSQLKQFVRIFEKYNQEYISIKSEFDQVSLVDSAMGIYRKENGKYIQAFKKTFDDNEGRWVNIEFGEDYSSRDPFFYLTSHGKGFSISGDIGYLGCVGACRLLWWDYYDWDSNKKTYVLANNKHPEQFKKLLEGYDEMDKTTCFNEAKMPESISSLYPTRMNKEKVCADNLQEPSTDIDQAEMLLKGKKAIELILQGENISMSQVKNVEIE